LRRRGRTEWLNGDGFSDPEIDPVNGMTTTSPAEVCERMRRVGGT
jgi:hypothetical protein